MNYSGLYFKDTNNGPGYRISLFVSGCNKNPKCKGCHNSKAWDFDFGRKFTQEEFLSILKEIENPNVFGLSILGGEPMDNLKDGVLIELVKTIKEKYPNKTIWCWTGYQFEDLIKDNLKKHFIEMLDVLIDGEFILELKNLKNKYGNSENQRVINVQESFLKGDVVYV